MSKRKIIIIAAALIIVVASAGAYIFFKNKANHNTTNHKSTPPQSSSAKPSLNDKIYRGPVQQVTLSNGHVSNVQANTLIAHIDDKNTVQSFGNNIRPGAIANTYIITVQGDLVKARAEIQKKPGVKWVDYVEAINHIDS